jgi:hypothetical protein
LNGLERIACVTSFTMRSVRASEAPSGRITGAKYQPWSSSGTKDPGVMRQRYPVMSTMPRNSTTATAPRRIIHATPFS